MIEYMIGNELDGLQMDIYETEAKALDAIESLVATWSESDSEMLRDAMTREWMLYPAESDYKYFQRIEAGECAVSVASDRIRDNHYIKQVDLSTMETVYTHKDGWL